MTIRRRRDDNTFWLGLAKSAGLICTVIGLLVLVGWLQDIAPFKSIDPDWIAMKANTAFGFVLAGLALWLKASPTLHSSPRWRRAEKIFAVIPLLFGLLTLLEYLLPLDFGIDQWLYRERETLIGTLPPGRMAPATALCFVLVGSALLLENRSSRQRWLVASLAVISGALALSAGLIYLYDTNHSYGVAYSLQLAVNTVLALCLLAAGLLFAQPEHGVIAQFRRNDSGGAVIRHLLPAILFLPILIGWLILNGERGRLYQADFGMALAALAYIVILGTLVLWSARILSRTDSERARMNAIIAEDDMLLRTLLNTIPDMVWLKNTHGIYLACNPAFERFFGAKEAAIVGKSDYDFVPCELADSFRANDQAAVTAGSPQVNEEWLTLADSGQRILAETTKTPMFDRFGKLQGVLGIARDITAQHSAAEKLKAEKAITERLLAEANQSKQALLSALEDSKAATQAQHLSEERYRTMIENSNDMIWALTAEGNFSFINQRAADITGYAIDEWLGKSFAPLVVEEDRQRVWEIHRRIMNGEKIHYEVRGKKANGETLILSVNASPILQNGREIGAISFSSDITARKHAEEELHRLNTELERRVQARTAELAASNKELEAFSYSVSHDLRAPLRSITGFVELLRKQGYDSIDDKGRHYMDVISQSAVQMGQLIDDILTFSRIGRAEITMHRINLDLVLKDVINTLRPQFEQRQVVWQLHPLPEVMGERTMLALVLQNLLSNALKFTQTRATAIIEIGTIEQGPDEIVCYVKDNGVGFDMRHVDKLFGLFQRLHPQTQFAGTGVGLANVHRMIQRHGGRVWAEGKIDEGATIYFSLPKKPEVPT